MIGRAAIFLTLIGLAAAIATAGCRTQRDSRAAVPEATALAPHLIHQQNGIELMTLTIRDVPGAAITEVKNVELPGVLETSGQVTFDDRRVSTIVSRVQGRIEQTRVSLWDNVARGERIVALYSPDFMTAEAELLQAKTTDQLSASPGVGNNGDFAGAMVAAARKKLELLGMDGADIRSIAEPNPTVWMRAPISGTVVENKAVRGAQVNPGDVLYSLGTLDDVWITGDIYEDDLSRVQVGQELEAVTTAFPDTVFKGTIARVSPNVDPNTHTLQIRCEVKNPGLRLKPQMLARVKIVTRPGQALVVPQDALVFETDAYYAFVEVSAGEIEHRRVAIGSWSGQGYARVISGLRAGERVITGETLQVNALWHQAHGESS
ncbi:MAG TPA: efflux RND transporter periplasmic adaptor subunit [Candidatus Acidoferrales bacterium]|nr:efflux RND transporter periplasmic adaptor subunit [Candidatus Acidoferrales bacterium]